MAKLSKTGKSWKYLVRFKSKESGKNRVFKTHKLPKARKVANHYNRQGLFIELVNTNGTKLTI